MSLSESVMAFLKSKQDFWSWGIYHIDHINRGIRFAANRLDKEFEIERNGNLYSVKIYQPKLMRSKLIQHYQAVNPEHLHDVIATSNEVQCA